MADLIDLQAPASSPLPVGVVAGTDLLLVPRRTADRLAHFPEEVYDLAAESHLVRFLKALLGESGTGQLRKRMLIARLQQTLQGSHFYDLDRFYGALFSLRRRPNELLSTDPYTGTATADEWTVMRGADASYRSRIIQFARAIGFGATPTGIELVAEAVLSVDCDVYESWIQADAAYRTYAELEAAYPTYAALEGVSYGVLEGEGLPRLSGNDRRQFTVRPKRQITLSEAYDLTKVLLAIKPADARFVIDYSGVVVHDPLAMRGVFADSQYWEVVPKVSARPGATTTPYQVVSNQPVEQPRPPFSGYQGESWSYNGDVVGVSAYQEHADGSGYADLAVQRVVFSDGTFIDYPASAAVMLQRYVVAGRVASDGILVSHPYAGPRQAAPAPFIDSAGQATTSARDRQTIAPIFADRIPLAALDEAFQRDPGLERSQQNPRDRYWVTPERAMEDDTLEVLEVRLAAERLDNYITFEVAHYPHQITAQVFNAQNGAWESVYATVITDSSPQYLSNAQAQNNIGHPQHSFSQHWVKCSVRIDPIGVTRFRLLLERTPGTPPMIPAKRSGAGGVVIPAAPLPYSLAVRNLDLGYRVTSREDIPADTEVIGTTTDVLNTSVQFTVHEEMASDILAGGIWRSEPQPVSYAVVNLYADVRDATGDSQVIDRFFLDPLYTGAHITLYYSTDVANPQSEADFEALSWTPISLDFVLQKGFIRIPPTRAHYWKFEFTNLVPEPYETFVPITRRVKFFPLEVTLTSKRGSAGVPDEALPGGMGSAIQIGSQVFFSDAVRAQRAVANPSTTYTATAALYAQDPLGAARLRDDSWVFGFTPWHQGDEAARFVKTGRHTYDTAEIVHAYQVGFFVGLKGLQAYRVNYAADDDTEVYVEHFDDFRNIQPGFTWTLDPNRLSTGTANNTVAQSKPMPSRHRVRALQFATQQTEPVQIVPDDDFLDPALAVYDWTDATDNWSVVGDAQLIYSPADNSVLMIRYVTPPLRASRRSPGLAQPITSPVGVEKTLSYADAAAAAATIGGIISPQVAPSNTRVYAAARVLVQSNLTSALRLQITDATGTTVLAEAIQQGQAGEMLEWYVGYDPGPDNVVRVRLVQTGKSDDQWKLDTLSLFDEGILWEFSVNGGTTFVPAKDIRNNENAVVVFPDAGNELVWRVRGLRQYMAVSSLKIRPWYVGLDNARLAGTHRGPNISTFDHSPPIQDDPEFTAWTKPVPRSWFSIARKYPIIAAEGRPQVTRYQRFFGRPVSESVGAPTDNATRFVFRPRSANERVVDVAVPIDVGTRSVIYKRSAGETAPIGDAGTAAKIPAYGGISQSIAHPVRP